MPTARRELLSLASPLGALAAPLGTIATPVSPLATLLRYRLLDAGGRYGLTTDELPADPMGAGAAARSNRGAAWSESAAQTDSTGSIGCSDQPVRMTVTWPVT